MHIVYLLVLLTWSLTAAAQDVWKYVDESGVTHYTDQFVPGAVKVQMRSGNATAATPSTNTAQTTERAGQQTGYRLFQIVQPASQESIVNTGGVVQVAMTLQPGLMTGHAVTLYLDGKQIEDFPRSALDHELQNVPRGEHTLVGVITDENSRRVIETTKVTFIVRQTSILMNPPVGPAVRPPPKPPTAPRAAPTRAAQPSYADLHPRSGDGPAL